MTIWRNVVLILAIGFLKGVMAGYLFWSLPLEAYEKYGVISFSIIFLFAGLCNIISSIAGGLLADVIGRKKTLIIADTSLLLSLLNLYFGNTYLAIILYNIADGLPTAASFTLRAESVDLKWRGKFIMSGPYISSSSRFTGSIVLGILGSQQAALAMLLLSSIVIALRLFTVETLRIKHTETSSIHLKEMKERLCHVKQLLRSTEAGSLLMFSLALGIARTSMIYLAPFLVKVASFSREQLALVMGIVQIARLATFMPLGHMMDMIRGKGLLRISVYALLHDSVLISLFATLTPFLKYMAFLIIGSAALVPLYRPAVNLYVVETRWRDRATILGLMHAIESAAQLALPFIAVAWLYSPILAFVSFACGARLLAAFCLSSYRRG